MFSYINDKYIGMISIKNEIVLRNIYFLCKFLKFFCIVFNLFHILNSTDDIHSKNRILFQHLSSVLIVLINNLKLISILKIIPNNFEPWISRLCSIYSIHNRLQLSYDYSHICYRMHSFIALFSTWLFIHSETHPSLTWHYAPAMLSFHTGLMCVPFFHSLSFHCILPSLLSSHCALFYGMV